MKRVLSIREKYLLSNGVSGGSWIAYGIVKLFKPTLVLDILGAIFMLICCISSVITLFKKTENGDELSEYNTMRAQSSVYFILVLIILFFMITLSFKEAFIVDLKFILPFLIGGIQLLDYIFFIRYDSIGE